VWALSERRCARVGNRRRMRAGGGARRFCDAGRGFWALSGGESHRARATVAEGFGFGPVDSGAVKKIGTIPACALSPAYPHYLNPAPQSLAARQALNPRVARSLMRGVDTPETGAILRALQGERRIRGGFVV
jgi:hypothetical protein